MPQPRDVFVTGGTGYIGRRLIPALVQRGHRVRALTRASSSQRVPHGAEVVVGDALDRASVAAALRAGDTLVHLVGTPHPSPAKAAEFQRVDFVSIQASVAAARERGIAHLVYVSVAHPAPTMQAYIAARTAGEQLIAASGIPSTVLRPWYVLGPGHWWPVLLVPLYAVAELMPSTRAGARRLGLVTMQQMAGTLVRVIEAGPGEGVEIVEVEGIRRGLLDKVRI